MRSFGIMLAVFVSAIICLSVALLLPKVYDGYRTGSMVASPAEEDSANRVDKNEPALPFSYIDTTYAPPTGRVITVGQGGLGSLQVALEQARAGDVITLEAGATFTGNFILPKKAGSGWITIRTSAADSSLPPPGTRVGPSHASLMPKLVSPNPDAAIKTMFGAHHYRFIGIEFTVAPDVEINYGIVRLGEGKEIDLESLPHDIIIDRCYIHGQPGRDVSRGVAINCARAAVIDSYISECHGVGFDTQAIAGWSGPGPFKIVNNYLEGAGENFILGGADPTIKDLVPSDIEFRRNHCRKPLSWKEGDPTYNGKHWAIKNLFELKNARRVLVDGNLFENNWVDAQNGFAILFTPRNQDGTAPWSVVEDVTFTNNIVRHTAGAINILGKDDNHPSGQTKRIKISNNLFDDIGSETWGSNGRFLQVHATIAVTVDHNTVLHTGNIITAGTEASPKFVFTNNLAPHNEYGVIGDGFGIGFPTLDKYFPERVFKKNVIIGGNSSSYPADNFFPAKIDQLKFVDKEKGHYQLSPASRFKKAGTDGKDIGCDMEALKAALGSLSSLITPGPSVGRS